MEATLTIAVLMAVLTFLLVRNIWRRRGFIIAAPRLGMLNLKGADGALWADQDARALMPVLGVAERSTSFAPLCDVLFVYSDLSADGRTAGTRMWLGDLVRASGATILVVASENPGPAYTASKGPGYGRVNLVMTLSRRGEAFPRFFVRLFEDMKRGTPMPMAWVKMAPQGPVPEHSELPSTIFACMAGGVRFRAA
jgi:hypothetical protein